MVSEIVLKREKFKKKDLVSYSVYKLLIDLTLNIELYKKLKVFKRNNDHFRQCHHYTAMKTCLHKLKLTNREHVGSNNSEQHKTSL